MKSEKKVLISIIASVGKNRELGKDNDLIWKIPEDLKYFKKVTLGHPVIMGEKTFHSIGRSLPGRTNIVLSRNAEFSCKDCIAAGSIKDAIETARKIEGKEIFFIGGASVYGQAIDLADKIYLTIIDAEGDADVFFPDYSKFKKTKQVGGGSFMGISYRFIVFEK